MDKKAATGDKAKILWSKKDPDNGQIIRCRIACLCPIKDTKQANEKIPMLYGINVESCPRCGAMYLLTEFGVVWISPAET